MCKLPFEDETGGNQIVHQRILPLPAAQSAWFNDRVKLFELNFTGAGCWASMSPSFLCTRCQRIGVNVLWHCCTARTTTTTRRPEYQKSRRPDDQGHKSTVCKIDWNWWCHLIGRMGFSFFTFSLRTAAQSSSYCRSFVFVLFNKFILLLALQCVMPGRLGRVSVCAKCAFDADTPSCRETKFGSPKLGKIRESHRGSPETRMEYLPYMLT